MTPKDGGAGGWGAPGFGGAAGGWGGYSDPYAYGGGYGGTSFIRLKKEPKFSVSDRYPGPFILHFDLDTDPGLPEKYPIKSKFNFYFVFLGIGYWYFFLQPNPNPHLS